MLIEAFVGWLVEQISDEVRTRLSDWVFGPEQERALRKVASVAIRRTAEELSQRDKARADQIATAVDQVFSVSTPDVRDGSSTILETLQAGIAQKLAVLDDAEITGSGKSWAEIVELPPDVLAEKLTSHVLQLILIRGASGGALTPLAAQLNADAASLQGRQTQDMIRRLTNLVLSLDFGDVIQNSLHINVYGNVLFAETGERTRLAREFEQRYRDAILDSLDQMELFGLDLPWGRKSYRLSTSYVDLSVDISGNNRGAVHIETVLRDTRLVLLEGAAGSGKSSVLRHLAISALRGDQVEVNASSPLIPFLLELRSLVSEAGLQLPDPEQFVQVMARPLGGLKPDHWVSGLLAGGRALVLVDGVDEVREEYRHKVLDWLKNLVKFFPESRYVLTARDAAIQEAWRDELRNRGFVTARLAPLNPVQVDQLVTRWYRAIVEADEYGSSFRFDIQRLRQTLASRGDMTKLAATPLMCAIMCALSENIHGDPVSRVDLYRTGVELLLYRRDVARSIRAADWQIAPDVSRELLSKIAFWMLINQQDAIPGTDVQPFVAEVTGQHDHDSTVAEIFMQRVLEQTGMLELTSEKSVVFRYPGFQDYLAARESLWKNYINYLIINAHQGRCRDVLILAAAQADSRQGDEIVTEIIRRAHGALGEGRAEWILAAECVAVRTDLAPRAMEVLQEVRQYLPPVTLEEAASVAQLGEPVLDLLVQISGERDLADSEVVATIRTAALINVDRAMNLFRRFKDRPEPIIQRELVAAWFWSAEPERYLDEVLCDSRLEDSLVELQSIDFLPYLDRINNLRNLSMPPETDSLDLEEMANLDNVSDRLESLSLANTAVSDLHSLEKFQYLRRLDLTGIPVERRIGLGQIPEVWVTG